MYCSHPRFRHDAFVTLAFVICWPLCLTVRQQLLQRQAASDCTSCWWFHGLLLAQVCIYAFALHVFLFRCSWQVLVQQCAIVLIFHCQLGAVGGAASSCIFGDLCRGVSVWYLCNFNSCLLPRHGGTSKLQCLSKQAKAWYVSSCMHACVVKRHSYALYDFVDKCVAACGMWHVAACGWSPSCTAAGRWGAECGAGWH